MPSHRWEEESDTFTRLNQTMNRRGRTLFEGISEEMSVDQSKHLVPAAWKPWPTSSLCRNMAATSRMPKPYASRARYLTGPQHAGVNEMHGFLSYLIDCNDNTGASTWVFGYKGKQVRDNLHRRGRSAVRAGVLYRAKDGGRVQHRWRETRTPADPRTLRDGRGCDRPNPMEVGSTSMSRASWTTFCLLLEICGRSRLITPAGQ